MARINKDNFLVWDGSFNQLAHSNVAVDDTANVVLAPGGYVDIPILVNDTYTFGINQDSVEITLQQNIANPAEYLKPAIRYYVDEALSVGDTVDLKYRWYDLLGNLSNEATVTI